MNLSRSKERNCIADIMETTKEIEHNKLEITGKKFQKSKKIVKWALIDETSPHFNRWKSSIGYIEAFAKYENPNVTKPFGMSSRSKSLSEEE